MTSIKEFEHYSDAEIIGKILEGESKLYELLIRRNNPFLYKIGRSYNYTHHDTEDLMQETYINAFYSLSKFEGKSSFKTWVTRIMLNNCYQKNKRSSYKNENPVHEITLEKNNPMFQNQASTEKTILNKELGHVLENALNKIPEDYRVVFTLRELNGLNVAETSEVTNITETNVKARLSRAKTMLRSEIEKMYSPEDIYEFNLVYCDRMVERVMANINTDK
ncbi:MAG: sigma-70 family RNA polymerase sigma factor [Bacteroidota bacterium]|nr:sigma-70 family RNA polymerase sigma factor [Bacteroidota bacterium]MDP3144204.1 sigma-70 family RNA polymerase sigma factor [Bacteroidota bacterium]